MFNNKMLYEQSQTNLARRSESRTDVRRISGTTRLTEVDCGKFLVLALAADTSLILPNASSCIGGQVDGMVVKNNGGHTLTIVGDQNSNDQLVGNYAGASVNVDGNAFGPHPNVPVGFGFSFVSTGNKWCIRVSGSPVTSSVPITTDLGDLRFSTTVEAASGLSFSTLSTGTNGIKLSPGPGRSIVMDTPNLVCVNTITATSLVGQVETPTQNSIRNIQDVIFDSTSGTASVQSSPGKDLRISCPSDKKVIIDGNLQVNGVIDANLGQILIAPTQNSIESIRDVFFETTPVAASVRSGTGKDLRLSCPLDKRLL